MPTYGQEKYERETLARAEEINGEYEGRLSKAEAALTASLTREAALQERVKQLEAALSKLIEFTNDGVWLNEDGSPHSKWDFDAVTELREARTALRVETK